MTIIPINAKKTAKKSIFFKHPKPLRYISPGRFL